MRKLIAVALFTLFSQASLAGWALNNEASTFNFLSTKKNAVTESHTFKEMSGSINKEGKATVSIQLSSVETNIDIRNERMMKFLFEVAKFANATADLSVNPAILNKLQSGEREPISADISLNLHGIKKELTANLMITKLANGALQVHTVKPILLKAADFGLADGIEKLRTLAKLSAIDTTVPATFTLIFSPHK